MREAKTKKRNSILALTAGLTLITNTVAQDMNHAPASRAAASGAVCYPVKSLVVVDGGTSQREWMRGYYSGYDRGFWAGVHDAKAGLPPQRFLFRDSAMRVTPYRHGYLSGFTNGYRAGFASPY